jgi:bifunctional non-homologous end joining protein LigD
VGVKKSIDPRKVPGARKSALPEFVTPQLATLVKEAPTGDEWLHEIKFDGYRLICRIDRGSIRIWTRNRNDWTSKFSNVAKALATMNVEQAIVDGEVVIQDSRGRISFQALQHSIGRKDAVFVYHLFDLMHLNGFDLTGASLEDRKAILKQLLDVAGDKKTLRYSDHVQGSGEEFFKQACKHSIEGIVSKRVDARYESTRNRNWLKIKCSRRQEFVVAGYTLSDKGLPFSSLVLGVYEKGQLLYSGRVGTGFTDKLRKELKHELDQISVSSSPLANMPRDPDLRTAHWAKPKLVAEVAFTEWTSDGSIRHPSFQGLREDKKPEQVRREVED